MVKRKLPHILCLILLLLLPSHTILATGEFEPRVSDVDTLVRVAFEPALPPYQFLDGDTPKGVHVDLMDYIAQQNHYTLEYYPMDSQLSCIEALNDGDVDIVLGITPNTCYQYQGVFTSPLSELTVCALTKKDRATTIRDHLDSQMYITSYQFKTIDYEYVSSIRLTQGILAANQLDALDQLISGNCDIMIGVKDTILFQLNELGLAGDYTIINNFVTPLTYTAIAPNRELRNSIDYTLRQMQFNGRYDDILDKWILGEEYQIRRIMNYTIGIILIILAVFFLVTMFSSRLNKMLKKKVDEKTAALQQQIIQTQNSNELRNMIFENSPLGIAVFDKNFSLSLINTSACRILGLGEAPLDRLWSDIPLFYQILEDKRTQIMQIARPFINQELYFHSASDGSKDDIIYQYDIYHLYEQDGTPRGFVLFFQDTTEQVRIKEHLYEQEKSITLNRMIAGIAHEIRNPLTAIKSLVELLSQAQDDDELREQIMVLVPQEVDRIHTLLTNLTNYAKPNQEDKETFDVGAAIQTSVALVRHMLEKMHILLKLDLQPGLVIHANRNQFRQVLLNIIINGAEAIQMLPQPHPIERSCIEISAWQDEQDVHILILDYGVGMTVQEIYRSVEPFYTQKASGTGLGLYLSKQYVEGNQGTLEIESVKNESTKVHIIFRRPVWKKVLS